MRPSSLAAVALLAGTLACSGSARGNQLSNSQVAAIDAVFRRFKADTPGCAVGVYRDGEVLFSKGYGSADLERGVPITPRMIFDLGSTSKQFAAASILLLAADGKLALTDEIQKYVPEVPRYQWPVTIDHLLRHTSGLRDYIGLMVLGGHRIDDVTDDADALAAIGRQRALNFEPGTRWLYSNSGYFLLSTIVQRVSGQTLAQFAKARIFEPLGMAETHFRTRHTAVLPHRALAYSPVDSATFELDMSNWEQTGDGAVHSNVLELARWDGNFADPKVGGQALIDQLTDPGTLADGSSHGYGRGLRADTYKGLKRISHGGSWGGYRAMYQRFPDQRIGIGITCNVANANTGRLADGVADAMLREVLTGTGPDSAAAKPAAVPVTGAEVTRLTGTYFNPGSGQLARILSRGDSARIALGGGNLPLERTADGYTAGGFIAIRIPEGTGPAEMLVVGEPTADTLKRIAPVNPSAAELAAVAGTYFSPELDTGWRIVLDQGRLRAEARTLEDVQLEPVFEDGFLADGNLIQLTRTGGRITGFTLSAGRMRGIGFERR